jgi:hypothetical protein
MPEEAVINFGKQVPRKRPCQPSELATATDLTNHGLGCTRGEMQHLGQVCWSKIRCASSGVIAPIAASS